MRVEYGRTLPDGYLPVYSVDTEEEAEQLIVATCPRDTEGYHYARELEYEQTLSNLAQFSQKLHRVAQLIAARAR